MEFSRNNPMTGEVASSATAMKAADIAPIAAKAAEGFQSWSVMGPNARRAVLMKAASALESKKDAFVEAMMGEIGATAGWAMFNLGLAASMIREAAALTTQINGEVIPSDKPGCLSMALREPVGVILGIAPWNAPIILGVRAIAVPLACGNSVILKASESCPRTHALIIEAFAEAGFPEGVVNVVTNAPEDAADVVGALIDAPQVRRINFTGSTAVGKIIAKRAAEHLKPVLLELGGKAPLVILEDADLDEAVKAAAFGAFMNQGQICMSTERIIVVDAVADAFAAKFKEKVASMPVGDPRQGNTPLGAVVDAKTVAHCQSLIEDALAKGATQLTGGETTHNVLMPAHVIDKVTQDMKLFRDESFGPVVGIIRARDTEHAVELANDTEYGLSASVFTKDIAKGLGIARRIQSGICHVNGPTVHDEAQMPFGGVKGSGYGRFGGKAGIDSFTELRWVTVETQPGHFPI
ncbi:acyl-CoA reductase-like NAD-dependent aldehyde dehydrogenase [Sphingobium sp. B2D3A]|uniref:aldehyde dehydrogenase n=1 Tax=unclassified Sphingobium TaxID=2611147 RepID=UPI0022250AA6|nr:MULTISPECIES: aldehyde dehydrogenase [unclassified Sphingobium]MCW2337512.1 acyl-CoA reductase-like NAD-dependent aldehyde dehydrogenase [Sphingobium sp. B2D3A]MCW2383970.1 acyl-CoA reductase-like NAD-dependent aldehyde dehydrogenase [Sphingobium sp. B2D3D]MCW2388471.1 acyl-CoA reductase-like NAD-dependent aldehyde dehydrogenase [Sphingobium sp. B11D3B]MCW2393505.1 acyl-CoA reductase-like NAD-dependent aldehyde dehydrogenase [Sphingobium sp. B11D3A]MCW2405443.1 acyl-CoA reductase-like NAD-d